MRGSAYRRFRRFSRTSMPQPWYGRNEETRRTGQDGSNVPENYIRFSNFVPRRFFSLNGRDDNSLEFRELRPVTPRDLLHVNSANNNNSNNNNNNNSGSNNNGSSNNNSNNNDNNNMTPFAPPSWSSSNEESSFQNRTENSSNNETGERDPNDARMIEIRYRNPQSSASNAADSPLRGGSFMIPVVHVNDVPVQGKPLNNF